MVIPPAFKSRPFLLYWIGHLISIAGSQMQLWALYWHLRTLSDQPMVISGIGLARFLPVVLLSLVAGVAADRFDRRKMAILTQLALGLVALLLGLTTALSVVSLWMIFGLMAIQSVAVAFDGPARQALIPSLVPRENLANAYSLTSIASKVGGILGPAISGVVIAFLGLQWAYWINAISYLAVIAALIAMGDIQTIIERKTFELRGTFRDIREGIEFIKNSPIIFSVMILDFFGTFFSSANTLLALRGTGYPACWSDPVWLVVLFPVHWHLVHWAVSFTENKTTSSGNVDFHFRGDVWPGDHSFWGFHLILVDHAGAHLDWHL